MQRRQARKGYLYIPSHEIQKNSNQESPSTWGLGSISGRNTAIACHTRLRIRCCSTECDTEDRLAGGSPPSLSSSNSPVILPNWQNKPGNGGSIRLRHLELLGAGGCAFSWTSWWPGLRPLRRRSSSSSCRKEGFARQRIRIRIPGQPPQQQPRPRNPRARERRCQGIPARDARGEPEAECNRRGMPCLGAVLFALLPLTRTNKMDTGSGKTQV